MVKVVIIVLVCTFVAAVIIGALFLIFIILGRPEDETYYLEEFLDVCTPTEKNKALARRELDMLRYKISSERFNELYDKFYDKFKTE